MSQQVVVLIVDDEMATRQILVNHIPWKELGVERVYDAKDGEEGLKLARELKPHIIISDIKMPHMNGIEMAKILRLEQPHNSFVFLSAYADKEYLKTAIQIKATNFIEKPIDLDEITGLVKELVQEVKMGMMKVETNLLEEQLMLKLHLEKEEFLKLFLKVRPSFRNATPYYIVAFKLHVLVPSSEYMLYQGVLEDKFKRDNSIKSLSEKGILFLITKVEERWYDFKDKVQNLVNEIVEKNEDALLFTAMIDHSVQLEDVQETCEILEEEINRCFFYRENQVYVVQAIQPAYEVDKTLFETFHNYLKQGKEQELMVCLYQLYDRFREANGTSINYVKNVYFKLIFAVLQEAEACKLGVKLQRREILDRLNEAETLYLTAHVVKETAKKLLEEVCRLPSEVDDVVYRMQQYLEEHYKEIEFSIKDMAEYFNFTQCYLCVVYKKRYGRTINQTLTQLRIEKAKELLKNPNLKLYDVAYEVGYVDGKYFTKVFNKIVGMTPKQFRERHWAYEREV